MARARNTPYGAQLNRLLAGEEELKAFSAATLEERFKHPPHQKRATNIGGIHKALRKAFAAGKILTFVDDHGVVLRESEVVVPGSKAIGQPQIFARPGVGSPDPAYHPVTYEETVRRGLSLDGDAASDGASASANGRAHGGDDRPEAERAEADSGEQIDEADAGEGDPSEPELSVDEALLRIRAYPPERTNAPDWVDERLLRAWASLPDVSKRMVHGLDVAVGIDKFELIRAGVTRKQRGWRSESTVAGNLARLARKSAGVWLNIARAAIDRYTTSPDGLPPAELPALAANPLDFYEGSDRPPDAVLLCAMALAADEAVLELIAADAASELGELKIADTATAQQERIQTLEAEAVELRRTAKEAEKALKAVRRREQALTEENKQLRAAQAEAGEAAAAAHAQADAQLLRRAETAEAALEKLEA